MAQEIRLIRVEYDLNNNPWKANILSLNPDDAVQTLLKQIKGAKIKTLSNEGVVHDISTKAVDIILKNKKSKDVPEKTEPEEIKYHCPWCDKVYDDPKYLKIHLNKGHNVKEQK